MDCRRWIPYEQEAFIEGYKTIAGIDEAGRGSLAGPVVAAAVILPIGTHIEGLKDSKLLTERKREAFFHRICSEASAIGIGIIDEKVIDEINIYKATIRAMVEATANLGVKPDCLLIDALSLPNISIPQKAIIKGDALCQSIAAASVIAKVTRDRIMIEYHGKYPQYNFIFHKGYGTKEHKGRIRDFGPCEIHRKTFRGVLQTCLSEDREGKYGSPEEGVW